MATTTTTTTSSGEIESTNTAVSEPSKSVRFATAEANTESIVAAAMENCEAVDKLFSNLSLPYSVSDEERDQVKEIERMREEAQRWEELKNRLRSLCGYCGAKDNIQWHRTIPERFGHQAFCKPTKEELAQQRHPVDCYDKYSRFMYSTGKDLRYGVPFIVKNAYGRTEEQFSWREDEEARCAYCGKLSKEEVVKCAHLPPMFLHTKFCSNDQCCTNYARFLKKTLAIPHAFRVEAEEFINPQYYGIREDDSLIRKVEALINARLKYAQDSADYICKL